MTAPLVAREGRDIKHLGQAGILNILLAAHATQNTLLSQTIRTAAISPAGKRLGMAAEGNY